MFFVDQRLFDALLSSDVLCQLLPGRSIGIECVRLVCNRLMVDADVDLKTPVVVSNDYRSFVVNDNLDLFETEKVKMNGLALCRLLTPKT